MTWNTNCAHFRGDVPCTPSKLYDCKCPDCTFYEPLTGRVLIVKLGATGDVIRTTPLLHHVREVYPHAEVWWLTESPDVIPTSVHKVLAFTPESILILQATDFDVVYSLDKDLPACALTSMLRTKQLYGFTLKDGKPSPANDLANHKFATGIFDDISKSNTCSYPQELIEMCGGVWNMQEYILPSGVPKHIERASPIVVGLNTGCGERWPTRRWPRTSWVELIQLLQNEQITCVLLGGPAEDEFNATLARETGATYYGVMPYDQFFGVTSACSVVVTAVTMALHAAIGLGVRVVLMNNIFNKHEFELYNRGEIVEPSRECVCYFNGTCKESRGSCMQDIAATAILDAIHRQISQAQS